MRTRWGLLIGIAVLVVGLVLLVMYLIPGSSWVDASRLESLDKIGAAASAYYRRNGRFPDGNTGWVPAGDCCHDCRYDRRLWTTAPWKWLGLTIDDPARIQLKYEGSGIGIRSRFRASVRSDEDCDRDYDVTWIEGTVAPDNTPQVSQPKGVLSNWIWRQR
jgi:hypothetical protein